MKRNADSRANCGGHVLVKALETPEQSRQWSSNIGCQTRMTRTGKSWANRDRLVGAVQRGIADPKFQTQAAGIFAPLRYLAPTKYAEELRDGEAQFRQLWKEMPWTDK